MMNPLKRLVRYRSARTGQFVSGEDAQANQDTTTSESTVAGRPLLPWEVITAAQRCIERNGVDATLERLAD